MKSNFFTAGLIFSSLAILSCKTVDLEAFSETDAEGDGTISSAAEEAEKNEEELHGLLIAEEMKVQDIESTWCLWKGQYMSLRKRKPRPT